MTLRAAIMAAGVAAWGGPAGAHITLEHQEAAAGSYYTAVLRVGHGCEGSPTTAVRVQIPEGIVGVRPQPKPDWDVEILRETLDPPRTDDEGNQITERVTEIRWIGGPLPDEHYEEFRMRLRLPDRPGETVYFPTVQDCEEGVHRWIEIPDEGGSAADYEEPAPGVTLTPAD